MCVCIYIYTYKNYRIRMFPTLRLGSFPVFRKPSPVSSTSHCFMNYLTGGVFLNPFSPFQSSTVLYFHGKTMDLPPPLRSFLSPRKLYVQMSNVKVGPTFVVDANKFTVLRERKGDVIATRLFCTNNRCQKKKK